MGSAEEKYKDLIETAKSEKRKWEPFKYEEHHILPRCLGGTDEKTNLVLLTVREHFRAHVLLSEMYPDNGKLSLACFRMLCGWQGKELEECEADFEAIRLKAAKYISSIHKGRKKSVQEIANIRAARLTAAPRTFSEEARANMAVANKIKAEKRKADGSDKRLAAKTVATRKANGSYNFSDEHRRKIGEAQIGREPWNKGKRGIYSEETKAKMSDAKKGKPNGRKGAKTGKPAWNSGKSGVYSEETLAKMRENLKGKPAWNKGKAGCFSEETKAKMSESQKARFAKAKAAKQNGIKSVEDTEIAKSSEEFSLEY